MVYITMTPSIVEALQKIQSIEGPAGGENKSCSEKDAAGEKSTDDGDDEAGLEPPPDGCGAEIKGTDEKIEERNMKSRSAQGSKVGTADSLGNMEEPPLTNPKLGNPISHGQVIDLSRQLKADGLSPMSLDILLRGARVYVAAPPPKPEPVSSLPSALSSKRWMLLVNSCGGHAWVHRPQECEYGERVAVNGMQDIERTSS